MIIFSEAAKAEIRKDFAENEELQIIDLDPFCLVRVSQTCLDLFVEKARIKGALLRREDTISLHKGYAVLFKKETVQELYQLAQDGEMPNDCMIRIMLATLRKT